MTTTSIAHLGIALSAIAAVIVGLNALVGRGPRGTVWLMSACLFTWATFLPIVLRNPDDLSLSREAEIVILVLRLGALVGAVLGILDSLQKRTSERAHHAAEWALRQPILWGLTVGGNFYALLYLEVIDSPLLWRYLAGHPVEIVEGVFFFVGMAFLTIRLMDLKAQRRVLAQTSLGSVPLGGQSVAECQSLLRELRQLPRRAQNTYLAQRLRDALEFVRRKGSADGLDDHLRHLEELDAVNMHAGYASLRIIIWAIPILGFLGTVIGITVAIASLSAQALEQSMTEVTQGLGVAFDTTAEALALTMILMFAKGLVEKVENRLLADVDAKTSQELLGRFEVSTVDKDPNVAVVRRMSEQVLEAVEALAARQAEVWKSSIDATYQQWADVSTATSSVIRDSLSASLRDTLDRHASRLAENAHEHAHKLDRSAEESTGRLREGLEKMGELLVEALHRHGEVLTATEKEIGEQNREHLSEVQAALGKAMVTASDRQENLIRQSEQLLKEMQIALVEAAGAAVHQQEQLVRQGDVLLKVVNSTGQIKKLEGALNQNLSTLQRAYNFEEMALNLSAAIQLLSARLGHFAVSDRDTQIAGDEPASQAA
jgi:biopolymer transport protein ExbB/TolQ